MNTRCNICPHHCVLSQGQVGFCHSRIGDKDGTRSKRYAYISALALDPIEKKPLYHYFPHKKILSIGTFGCTMACPFCQNHEIAMQDGAGQGKRMQADALVALALSLRKEGNIGLAFTYNEPFVAWEFVLETCRKAKEAKLHTVLVTNGCVCADIFARLLPYVDAMNIDLKAFRADLYAQLQGDIEQVKQNIQDAVHAGVHVEITSLIVPGFNDSREDFEAEVAWLAEVDKDIPLHITRFFPGYHMQDRLPTPVSTLQEFADIACERLTHVHIGNV